jgi:hypothetical protein
VALRAEAHGLGEELVSLVIRLGQKPLADLVALGAPEPQPVDS